MALTAISSRELIKAAKISARKNPYVRSLDGSRVARDRPQRQEKGQHIAEHMAGIADQRKRAGDQTARKFDYKK